MTANVAALDVSGLSAGYGFGRRIRPALVDATVVVERGRALGVVGESGSGKSTFAKALVGLLPPLTGTVRIDGADTALLRGRARRAARRSIQLIPQDPYASLDPRLTIGESLLEALDPTKLRRRQFTDRIAAALERVHLEPAAAGRYPHEFSGGQRQRVAIARALAVEPRVIVADEVTSALDASVQASVLDLLRELQRTDDLAFVFITHDLSIAEYMCDDVMVVHHGRVVEQGPIDILRSPNDPYTRSLIASIPDPEGSFLKVAGQ